MTDPFTHRFRVRYSEVDPQSIVFNSRYLEYADILVTEFYRDKRAKGLEHDLECHIRHAEIDYLAPIRVDELIEGRLIVEAIGRTSITKRVGLYGANDGDRRAEITLVAVHVEMPGGRPAPIPDSIRSAFGFPLSADVQ